MGYNGFGRTGINAWSVLLSFLIAYRKASLLVYTVMSHRGQSVRSTRVEERIIAPVLSPDFLIQTLPVCLLRTISRLPCKSIPL